MTEQKRLFDPEHPERDPVGTVRQGEDEHAGTWVCEPYRPAEGLEMHRRWRCLDAADVMLLGETVSHRWLVGARVVGAVVGTPAAPLWAAAQRFVPPVQVFNPMTVTDESFTPEQLRVVRSIARIDGRVHAIKAVRDFLPGSGLVTSRDYVDDLLAQLERDDHNLTMADCRCVVSCADDPATACSLSGTNHVHPDDGTGLFGRCPLHPDAPGDL